MAAKKNGKNEAQPRKAGSPGGPRKPSVLIDDTEFVKVWQASSSIADVAKHFNIEDATILNQKAVRMRKHSVPLKSMRGGPRVDYSELIVLATELAPEAS